MKRSYVGPGIFVKQVAVSKAFVVGVAFTCEPEPAESWPFDRWRFTVAEEDAHHFASFGDWLGWTAGVAEGKVTK